MKSEKSIPKSEKLCKLEGALSDLHRWQELGMVPSSELEKHQIEVAQLEKKIQEEQRKLENSKPDEIAAKKTATAAKIEEQIAERIDSIAGREDEELGEEETFEDGNRWERGVLEEDWG